METVFVALDDPAVRDQVKTCIKNFVNLRPVNIPPDHLLEVLAGDHKASALILEWRGSGSRPDPVIETIRQTNEHLKILVIGRRPQRERSHRIRMEQDIMSFIPIPLDPYDLARRLSRLSASLEPVSS